MKRFAYLLPFFAGLAACGDRSAAWEDAPATTSLTVGLADRVVVIDDALHRALAIAPQADGSARFTTTTVGHTVTAAVATADRARLLVLAAGDQPRKTNKDEPPSLAILTATGSQRFPLESPHSGVALDPEGRYAALYALPAAAGSTPNFVENPNEIVIVDAAPGEAPRLVPHTLRSFGGRPQRLTFTAPLGLPGGTRRLLVVETDRDISLVDLASIHDPTPRPDITIRLTSGSSATTAKPAGIAIDDGDPTVDDDARIGVRLDNDASVVLITLSRGTNGELQPTLNLAAVGGTPTDIAFVRAGAGSADPTKAGLRLAALVPGTRRAVLVDPATSITTDVSLPDAYSKLALVTAEAGGGAGGDVALLYGGYTSASGGVAFLSLGKASGEPYRSVEVLSLGSAIGSVLAVPAPNANLKILSQTNGAGFFVLDLAARTASPLQTRSAASLLTAADGSRLWAYQARTGNLSRIGLDDLHPVSVPLERPIDAAFDVARVGGGRTLIALDKSGLFAATLVDADRPDATQARTYPAIALEGIQ